ncbi:hypothetical protein GCM10010841_13790 [Deinococcus aerophilus]|uniref:Uncharacterized protein n=1 Tax=Deinococcus aerophilus TaxID=522488 RepID=A0ABQ2GPJ3_9DEIO|nr:hypothetical protein GCM10010841_13790 [Deinococcus aerophilus]
MLTQIRGAVRAGGYGFRPGLSGTGDVLLFHGRSCGLRDLPLTCSPLNSARISVWVSRPPLVWRAF